MLPTMNSDARPDPRITIFVCMLQTNGMRRRRHRIMRRSICHRHQSCEILRDISAKYPQVHASSIAERRQAVNKAVVKVKRFYRGARACRGKVDPLFRQVHASQVFELARILFDQVIPPDRKAR
jgi:hypothetical protein